MLDESICHLGCVESIMFLLFYFDFHVASGVGLHCLPMILLGVRVD